MTNVEEYIKTFSPDVQMLLEQVRATIQNKAPDAIESIS